MGVVCPQVLLWPLCCHLSPTFSLPILSFDIEEISDLDETDIDDDSNEEVKKLPGCAASKQDDHRAVSAPHPQDTRQVNEIQLWYRDFVIWFFHREN